MGARPPNPLRALGPRGRAFHGAVMARLEPDPDDAELLLEACRVVDIIERLQTEVQAADLTSTGSTGQLVAHPLLSELRGERVLLARLLRQLDLPEPDDDEQWAVEQMFSTPVMTDPTDRREPGAPGDRPPGTRPTTPTTKGSIEWVRLC